MNALFRAARVVLVAALSALPVQAAQTDAAGVPAGDSLSLDQLMATLRTVRHVEARYVERRTLRALRTPIETRGTLRYDAPDRLEKTTDPAVNGNLDRLAIKGGQLTIDRGNGAAPLVLMLNEHPEVGVLVDSIRATLSGDGDALRRTFDIALAGTIQGWQFVLQPRNPAQRNLLQWMRVTGHGNRITAIDTQDGDGDRSDMTIVDRTP